jgi:2-isopropylmalate synthase
LFEALSRALRLKEVELTSYRLAPVSPGEDGLASVAVEVTGYGYHTAGHGADADVLKASALALKEALGSLAGQVMKEGAAV